MAVERVGESDVVQYRRNVVELVVKGDTVRAGVRRSPQVGADAVVQQRRRVETGRHRKCSRGGGCLREHMSVNARDYHRHFKFEASISTGLELLRVRPRGSVSRAVSEGDNASPVTAQEFLAQRADDIRWLSTSHSTFLSEPAALAQLIRHVLASD